MLDATAVFDGDNFVGRTVEFRTFWSDLFAVQFSILEKTKKTLLLASKFGSALGFVEMELQEE